MTKLTLIVAKASNNVIGSNNDLPWHLAEDLEHFKRTTLGRPIVMGRKTFESLGRALPYRRNIVVSRNPDWHGADVEVVHSLDAAIALCADSDEIFIIGGAQLFEEAIPRADRMIVTELHRDYAGDVYFTAVPTDLHEVSRESCRATADPTLHFDFVVYER